MTVRYYPGTYVGVSPKFLPLFGPRATAYKFTDPDLSARANAELVKGSFL